MSKMTRFDYLLNAFEDASQSGAPGDNGYAEKRQALYGYVRALEAFARQARSTCDSLGASVRSLDSTMGRAPHATDAPAPAPAGGAR